MEWPPEYDIMSRNHISYSHLSPTIITAVLHTISCFTEPCYNELDHFIVIVDDDVNRIFLIVKQMIQYFPYGVYKECRLVNFGIGDN